MASLTAGFTTLTRRAKGQTYRSFSNPHTVSILLSSLVLLSKPAKMCI